MKYVGSFIIEDDMLQNVDREKFGDPKPKHIVRYRVKKMHEQFLKGESVTAQAQFLRCLLVSKKLKEAWSLLGIQKETKDTKVKQNVAENIAGAIKSIGKSRKRDTSAARRIIQTAIISSSTRKARLTTRIARVIGTSRKTLYKYNKFRLRIDENDELACWAIICRQPYKDRLGENVKAMIHEYWVANSRVSPNARDVIRRRISRNQYESHPKHILEMTQIELFNKYKDEHKEAIVSINTFVQQKPWYVRPITVRDTCCCRYHVEFELYYDTFLRFGKTFWEKSPPSTIRAFITEILCERDNHEIFYNKRCVGGKKCDGCGELALFHQKYPIDMNDQSLSNIIVDWKRYEYVSYNSGGASSKRIDLQEDKIVVTEFLKKFEKEIYKYIKHSHRARWQDIQFKQSRNVFPVGTIFSVVDFAENYTFQAQKEIQSEYYHSDQVSIFVHVLYRHAQHNVDDIESTNDNRHVIKEYHFYISDDRMHDTHYVQHCFDIIYDSLKTRGILINEHWIWSDGCAGQFKSSRSFFWLCRLQRKTNIKHHWNFFETGHGKGEHDGAGACVKRALRRHQMSHSADRFVSADQVVQWCRLNLSHEYNHRSKDVRRYEL